MSVVQRVPGVPARRVLYLDGYTIPAEQEAPTGDAPSSDGVGYGNTASTVIRKGLEATGFDVVRPKIAVPSDSDGRVARLRWLLRRTTGCSTS